MDLDKNNFKKISVTDLWDIKLSTVIGIKNKKSDKFIPEMLFYLSDFENSFKKRYINPIKPFEIPKLLPLHPDESAFNILYLDNTRLVSFEENDLYLYRYLPANSLKFILD